MRGYRRYLGRQVMVTTGETTFAGELAVAARGRLELVDAAVVADDGSRSATLAGRMVVEGAHVRWVQVLP